MKYPNYIFKAVEEPTVVQVLDIPLGAEYLQEVKTYLMTKAKSGGTKKADFYGKPDPKCGFCLIDLKDPKASVQNL
ncbi:hypothetical protein CHS0354_037269 [Potamilus streckersoni]|uniref:Uncharacterized protein n=1 Tax=Potamilus streckersoni TaxID=2493646 RepID=A0AAE0SY79_9BIVA|nr:hypothetical protein CHS0354_037269 [Potamilus streckersoni]